MLIPQKEEVISRSPDLDLTAANFPAQTKRIQLTRTGPIEAIFIIVQVTLNALLTDLITFGLLNLLKKVTLNVNDGTGAYDAVYSSGPGLIVLQDQEGVSLDRSTQSALFQSLAALQGAGTGPQIPTGSIFRICYPIWCPHPALGEWLRLRSLIPAHRHVQDPVLTMDFAPAAEISQSVANPFSAANLEVMIIRRDLPSALDQQLIDSGGYIRWDIRETPFDLPLGTNAEKRFALPGPGDYPSLAGYMYKGFTGGGLESKLSDLSASATVGSESLWRLEAAQNSIRQWRMKGRQIYNDQTRGGCRQTSIMNLFGGSAAATWITTLSNLGVTGGAPPVLLTATTLGMPQNMGGDLAAGLAVQEPAVFGFDFVTDTMLAGANELGGCLDANFASDAIKWEIVAPIDVTRGTAATASSSLNLIGRRYRDNITRWKKYPIVQ